MAEAVTLAEKIHWIKLFILHNESAFEAQKQLYQEWIKQGKIPLRRRPALAGQCQVMAYLQKDKVYSRQIRTIEDLKQAIRDEIDQLRQQTDLLRRVCEAVTARAHECMEADGKQFECFR